MVMFFNILSSGLLLYTSAFNLNYTELEFGGRFCGNFSSCTNYSTDEKRNCYCDEKCDVYNDCCIDSPLYNSSITARIKAIYPFVCIHTTHGYFYMKNRCPSSWTDENTRKLCEAFYDQDAWLTTDPLVGIHVTSSVRDKITYTNVHCARCNHDDLNLYYWNLYCDMNIITSRDYLNNTVYISTLHKWKIKVKGKDINCSAIEPTPDESIKNRYVRNCSPQLIKTCPPDSNFNDSCQLYTSIIYRGHISYRNVHCALCNSVPLKELSCNLCEELFYFCKFVEKPSSVASLSVVLDFKSFETVGMFKPCEHDIELFDPYFNKCRIANIRCNLKSDDIGSCSTYYLDKSEYLYIARNNSIFVPTYNKLFNSSNFYFPYDDGGDVAICISASIGRKLISKYKLYFDILTLVGITFSIICLVTHLLVFSLVEHLRNLPGMNLASYCLSLLMTYCSFLLNDYGKDRPQICQLIAIVTYYFLLTSFFWMLAIGFDVWRTIHWATFKIHVIYFNQWKVFIAYSCCSWLMSIVIVSISIITEMSTNIYQQFHPGFGVISCWFSNGEALLVFLVIPLRVIMTLNFIFFVSSVFMIYRNPRAMTGEYSPQSSNTLKNFRLYSQLAMLIGLTWIAGLIAAELDNEYTWVVFIVLNTLQGFFIFVGFTCKKEVFDALKRIAYLKIFSFSSAIMADASIDANNETSDMFECSTQLS